MIVMTVGDVCAEGGVKFLEQKLPVLKKYYGVDMTVVNGENSAPGGIGITGAGIRRIFAAGADVITTGNHAFDMQGYENLYENTEALIRPYNLGRGIPGRGTYLFDMGRARVLVINLVARSFMNMQPENYFNAMEEILKETETPIVIVDFHGETTGEKIAFARNFDGKASLIYGTHTHVQTADERVFPNGTAYITDVGMTGPRDSVIGVDIERAIKKQRFSVPIRFVPAEGPNMLNGVFAEVDEKTGRARSIERISVEE